MKKMGAIGQLFNRETSLNLNFWEDHFILYCWYGKERASIGLLMEKWPDLEEIFCYFDGMDSAMADIPIDKLEEVRNKLMEIRGRLEKYTQFSVELDKTASAFIVTTRPLENFTIRYAWDGEAMQRVLPKNARIVKDGWMMQDKIAWHCHLPDRESEMLQMARIPYSEIYPFLRDELPVLRDAGIDVQCDLHYDEQPAMTIALRQVSKDQVILCPEWRYPPETARTWPVTNYMLMGDTVCPGVNPKTFRRFFEDDEKELRLEGTEIAAFMDQWYSTFKPWMTGDLQLLEALHPWIEPPFHCFILAKAKKHEAYGYPVACLGEEKLLLRDVKTMLNSEYMRLESGWVRKKDLEVLEKQLTEPFRLNIKQVLHRGDAALDQKWEGMALHGVSWVCSANKHTSARHHMEYLRLWGLPGGLSGGYEAFYTYYIPVLLKELRSSPDLKVLLLLERSDMKALREAAVLEQETQVTIQEYEKLPNDETLMKTAWDIVAFVEPESEKELTSGKWVLQVLEKLQAKWKICFPLSDVRVEDGKNAAALEVMLHIEEKAMLPYLISNPRKPMKRPDYFDFHNQLTDEQMKIADVDSLIAERKPNRESVRQSTDEQVRKAQETKPPVVPQAKENKSPAVPQAKEPKPPEITIDLERLSRLRQETTDMRQTVLSTLERPEERKVEVTPLFIPIAQEDWKSFFAAADREAVQALLISNDALHDYARKIGRMPQVIVDEINELAQDTIGDVLWDEEGIPEEYRKALEKYVTEA